MKRNNRYCCMPETTDHGPEPFVTNIGCAVRQNPYYRAALWTGCHLQVTLMCIPSHEETGLEMHSDTDQFICVEEGCALVMMGQNKNCMDFQQRADRGCAVMVPACTWHNIINIGKTPLKLYTVYGPPEHPFGTIQETKKDNCDRHENHSCCQR